MPPSRRWRFFIDSSWKLEDLDRNGRPDQSVNGVARPCLVHPFTAPGSLGLVDARRLPPSSALPPLSSDRVGYWQDARQRRTVGTATSTSS